MGLFTYTVAGGGLILIGAWESLISSSEYLKSNPSSFSSSVAGRIKILTEPQGTVIFIDGILANIKESFRFPLTMLNVIYAFAFGEEFLLFYTQNKDPSGIENRYYDLILIPLLYVYFPLFSN
ncbi:UNVERIFIED_CONTAM: hypothetical protein Sradi_0965600 [Sesamum radiatum]|uniref:Uncharacterized protein n=1 Tax=Sesamum radiatum TaxID=300843 RepID=A0AAW2V5V3_SESRA